MKAFGKIASRAVFVVLILLTVQPAWAQFQRLRIPSGSYSVAGESVNIAARCIDAGIATPRPSNVFEGASGSITISRLKNGKVVETKPLQDTLGDWVDMTGNGTADGFRLKPRERGQEFRLDVAEGGVVGPTREGVAKAAQALMGERAATTVKNLDQFEKSLRTAVGDDSGLRGWFDTKKHELEWSWLAPEKDPAEEFAKFKSALQEAFEGQSPEEALLSLSVLHGDKLNEAQASRLATLLQVKVATEYPPSYADALGALSVARSHLRAALGRGIPGRPPLPIELLPPKSSDSIRDLAKETEAAAVKLNKSSDAADSVGKVLGPGSGIVQRLRSPDAAERTMLTPSPWQELAFGNSWGAISEDPQAALRKATLLHGGELTPDQIRQVEAAFGLKLAPAYEPTFIPELRRFLAARSAVEAAFGPAHPISIALNGAAEDYSGSVPLGDVVRRTTSGFVPPGVLKVRAPADFLSLHIGEKLDAAKLKALGDLVGVDLGRPSGSLDGVAILSRPWDAVRGNSFDIKTANGTRRIKPATLTELAEQLGPYRKAVILEDEGLAEALKRKGVPTERWNDLVGDARRDAFEEALNERPSGKVTVERHFAAKKGEELVLDYVDLHGMGDSILLKGPGPDQPMVLIDTGLSEKGYQAILAGLAEGKGNAAGRPRIKVTITHQDADHLQGLRRLLTDGRNQVELEEVIISRFDSPTELVGEVNALLGQTHEVVRLPDAPLVDVWVPKGTAKTAELPKVVATADDRFKLLELPGVNDVRIQLLQYQEPANPNQSAFISKVTHKNQSQLLTSDIDFQVMSELLDAAPDLEETFSLRSDVLKWPHHISFPKSPSPRVQETMEEFIKAVDPHTVVFSNRGANQKDAAYKAATEFIRDQVGRLKTLWTRERGTVRWVTLEVDFGTDYTGTVNRPSSRSISTG